MWMSNASAPSGNLRWVVVVVVSLVGVMVLPATPDTTYAAVAADAPPASLRSPRALLGLVTATNGKTYAVGGEGPIGGALVALGDVDEYDPSLNTWTPKAPMPTPRSALAVVASSNGKIYAIGGWANGQEVATVEEFDPSSNTWSLRAPMPTARRRLAGAEVGGVILAVGGTNLSLSSMSLNDVEAYEPTTNSWTSVPNEPLYARQSQMVALALDGDIHLIGGTSAAQAPLSASTAHSVFAPVANAWSEAALLPSPRRSLAGVVGANGRLYAIGGAVGASSQTTSAIEEYDPALNRWRTMPPLREARGGLSAARLTDGRIMVVGGKSQELSDDPTVYQSTVEVFDPVDVTRPSMGSLTVNGGALGTTTATVQLRLAASDNSGFVPEMSFSNDGMSWSEWRPFGQTATWAVSDGDGPKTVYGRVRDHAGNVSVPRTATIALDTSLGSQYGLSIDQAALYTPDVNVTLSIPATAGTSEMQVSNDGGFIGVPWEPYATSKPWQITRYGEYVIPRTVYVRFKDGAGAISGQYQDDIILDETAPTGSVALPTAEAASAIGPVRTVRLAASDDLSPPSRMQMRLSNRTDFAGAVWRAYAESAPWDFTGGGTVYAQFRDGAGNASAVTSVSLPGAGGPGTSPTPNCSPRPRVVVTPRAENGTLVVTLQTTGANNGLRAVRFDAFANAVVDVGLQTNQAAPFAVSIPAGQEPTSLPFTVKRQSTTQGGGAATVRLVVIDGCGEWSTFVGGGARAF